MNQWTIACRRSGEKIYHRVSDLNLSWEHAAALASWANYADGPVVYVAMPSREAELSGRVHVTDVKRHLGGDGTLWPVFEDGLLPFPPRRMPGDINAPQIALHKQEQRCEHTFHRADVQSVVLHCRHGHPAYVNVATLWGYDSEGGSFTREEPCDTQTVAYGLTLAGQTAAVQALVEKHLGEKWLAGYRGRGWAVEAAGHSIKREED